jgi:hypothetical protein
MCTAHWLKVWTLEPDSLGTKPGSVTSYGILSNLLNPLAFLLSHLQTGKEH